MLSSPETVKRVTWIFAGTGIKFTDAGSIGGPPRDGHDPTFYASAAAEDRSVLDGLAALSNGQGGWGGTCECAQDDICSERSSNFRCEPCIMLDEYECILTPALTAHASSPATAEALVKVLSLSQPGVLVRMEGLCDYAPESTPVQGRCLQCLQWAETEATSTGGSLGCTSELECRWI